MGARSQESGVGKIESFRDLRVWQAGMDLVEQTYHTTQRFPTSETVGLAVQMRLAAVSVPSNIAEGYARESSKEYLQHVSIAQGSLAELETQLEIASRLGCLQVGEAGTFLSPIAALRKQLFSLRNATSRKLDLTSDSRLLTPDSRLPADDRT
jgi:four helix bundle protein